MIFRVFASSREANRVFFSREAAKQVWQVWRGEMSDAGELMSQGGEESEDARNVEELSAIVVDAAYRLHRDLGPGLLESVYETILCRILLDKGLKVERQKVIEFEYGGMRFDDGFRVDLLVADRLLVELKSVENLAPVHGKQLLTYLRLLHLPLGLLINFGAATFKEGCKRIVNNHRDFESSRLRLRATEVDGDN